MLCQMAYNEASKKAVGIRVFRTKAWSWSTTVRFLVLPYLHLNSCPPPTLGVSSAMAGW